MNKIEIVGDNINNFCTVIKTINEMVEEVSFNFTNEGVDLIAMNNSNVAMVQLDIIKGFFATFEGEPSKHSINLNNLKDVLKRCKTEKITLEFDKKLEVSCKVENRIKTFSIDLIADFEDNSSNKVPNLEYETIIEMNSSLLLEAIEDTLVGIKGNTTLTFKLETDSLMMGADKEDGINNWLTTKEINLIKNKAFNARFSTDFLKRLIINNKEKTRFYLNSGYPLKVEYDFPNMKLVYILAPIVDNT